nr:immunoglobulin light chain junction region [Macaca mulatta]MPN82637.1 immunoglobulin light chain junction region [Macaca mulatta]
CRQGYSSPSSF